MGVSRKTDFIVSIESKKFRLLVNPLWMYPRRLSQAIREAYIACQKSHRKSITVKILIEVEAVEFGS